MKLPDFIFSKNCHSLMLAEKCVAKSIQHYIKTKSAITAHIYILQMGILDIAFLPPELVYTPHF